MSESYEAILFHGDEATAVSAFRALRAPFSIQLLRVAEGVFGIHRVAGRTERFDIDTINRLAGEVSKAVSVSLAVFYDNSEGLRSAALFRGGQASGRFGEDDELWVPLDENGEPLVNLPPIKAAELDPDEEYDCLKDAIELGLLAAGISPDVKRGTLKDAFCYAKAPVLGEM